MKSLNVDFQSAFRPLPARGLSCSVIQEDQPGTERVCWIILDSCQSFEFQLADTSEAFTEGEAGYLRQIVDRKGETLFGAPVKNPQDGVRKFFVILALKIRVEVVCRLMARNHPPLQRCSCPFSLRDPFSQAPDSTGLLRSVST